MKPTTFLIFFTLVLVALSACKKLENRADQPIKPQAESDSVLVFKLSELPPDDDRKYSPYWISSRTIPKEFLEAFYFLEFIKYPVEPRGGFNAADAPRWDIKLLDSFMSTNGIEFADENHDSEGHLSLEAIAQSISSRKGKTFSTFSHLAHIYSCRYKQYSELSFEKVGINLFVINVSNWYRLTFSNENGRLKLVRVHYLLLEGD